MRSFTIILTLLSSLYFGCHSFSMHDVNTPPVLSLNRRWQLEDNFPVGSVVERASASDSENDQLEFGLERKMDLHFGLPQYRMDTKTDHKPLPFTIDSLTGVIKTNQSLMDRGGENMFLYVTVSDGKLTQKSEVWVTVVNSSAPLKVNGNSSPFRHPSIVGPPPPRLPPFPNPSEPLYVNTPVVPIKEVTSMVSEMSKEPQTVAPTTTLIPSTTTSTTTQKPETTEKITTTSTSPSSPVPSAETAPVPAVPSPIAPSPTAIDLALTIVPVAIVCIMFGLAGITAFLFRKRLCKKYKASKKKSSEMKKKKSGGREDSIVMQQWSGPRASSNRYEPWTDSAMPPPTQTAPAPPEKPTDRWEYPRHQLKVFNILGEGCFGQVWKCQANNIDGNDGPTIVAVKTLKENAAERERTDLLQELQVMKSLDPHPNVVRLIGCCTDKDPIFVIMEYVSKGKLQSLLRNSRAQRCYDNLHGKSASLTSRNLTSFCYQVARGMHFLSNKGIIHRDLAARNVLVAEDMTCKVADFGFARDVLASHIYERKSEGRLPIRWMAPESLYDNLFSVKSDVWSFGVLIWEVVTLGSTPYPGLSAGEVMRRVRDGYRLDKPEHCRRELYNIMYYCWDQDPAKRPDFPEISTLLEQLLLSETDYIELQHFPDHSYYNIVSLSGEKL